MIDQANVQANVGFAWGTRDCATAAMDHAEQLKGQALPWRPDYETEAEGHALAADYGGWRQIGNAVLIPAGFVRMIDVPQRDDIILVKLPKIGEAFGVMGDTMMRFPNAQGVSLIKLQLARVSAIWRLPCRK